MTAIENEVSELKKVQKDLAFCKNIINMMETINVKWCDADMRRKDIAKQFNKYCEHFGIKKIYG